MSQTKSDYQSYLLRLQRANNAGWPNWWASLESTATGECRNFADLDGLVAFLEMRTSGVGSGVSAQTVVALVECLQAGNTQASLHLARLLEADWGGALLPMAAKTARRLGLPHETVYEALTGAARDCRQGQKEEAAVPLEGGAHLEDASVVKLQQAEEALRRRNRELALLNRASQVVNSTLDLDRVLAAILEEVRRLLGVVACSIWLIEPETDELICWQASGLGSDTVRGWRLAPGEGIVGWVARNGESLIVPDTQADERYLDEVSQQAGLTLHSIISVPLRVKDSVLGVLQAMDTEVDFFRPADLTLLELLTAPAAIAIENARLVEALRQRTVELEASNEELDTFAHTVAHDLKNPLAMVISYAEVLEKDHATFSGEELRRYLGMIARGGCKMNSIIDELLLLASTHKLEVRMGPLDMESIVAGAILRLALVIEEYDAQIILPDAWPVVLGYGPWVEEIWVNYLSNGIKHGSKLEEGIPPRIELGFDEPTTERVGGSAAGQGEGSSSHRFADAHIRFWVRDGGPGIPPEAQERLFTPFTRLGQVGAEGHGLGLSIVQRIVERLGGDFGVESQVGRGSVFFFTLPVLPEDQLPADPPPSTGDPAHPAGPSPAAPSV